MSSEAIVSKSADTPVGEAANEGATVVTAAPEAASQPAQDPQTPEVASVAATGTGDTIAQSADEAATRVATTAESSTMTGSTAPPEGSSAVAAAQTVASEQALLQGPVVGETATTQSVAMVMESGTAAALSVAMIKTIPKTAETEVPKFALLTADERVKNAVALLNSGESQLAEKELADALVIAPNNRSARKLMRHLREAPENFIKDDDGYFEYTLKPNETLMNVAEKYLGDPLDFYFLAKLNDIKHPGSIAPGKVLTIPGHGDGVVSVSRSRSAPTPEQLLPPIKTADEIKMERAKVYFAERWYKEAIALLKPYTKHEPEAQHAEWRELLAQSYLELSKDLIKNGNLLEAQATLESSVNALPGNKALNKQLLMVKNTREAERLYHLGLQESKNGDGVKAVEILTKALQLNPDHPEAKKQLTDLRLTVVDEYHKQAMILYRKQDLTRAIEIWESVLRLDPAHELAKQYREKALELKQKIEQL